MTQVALPALLRRLRKHRGMSQLYLAEAADVDLHTISRIEQGRGGKWSRRTAILVFEALAKASPLTETEAGQFYYATQILPGLDYPILPTHMAITLAARGLVRLDGSPPSNTEYLDPRLAMHALIEEVGEHAAAIAINSLVEVVRARGPIDQALPEGS